MGALTALVNARTGRVGSPGAVGLGAHRRAAGALGNARDGAAVRAVSRLAPLWGMPSDPAPAAAGLSAEMRVGSVAQLALDDSIALHPVQCPPPPQHRIYLRGPVLGRFDGQEWTVASPASRAAPAATCACKALP